MSHGRKVKSLKYYRMNTLIYFKNVLRYWNTWNLKSLLKYFCVNSFCNYQDVLPARKSKIVLSIVRKRADVKSLLKCLSLFTREKDGRRANWQKGHSRKTGFRRKVQRRLLRRHHIINRANAIDAERISLKRIPTYIMPIAAVRRSEDVIVNHSILFTGRTGKNDNSSSDLPSTSLV